MEMEIRFDSESCILGLTYSIIPFTSYENQKGINQKYDEDVDRSAQDLLYSILQNQMMRV